MSFTEKFERIFSAVTFAEAGEFETARGILNESSAAPSSDALASELTIDDLISTAVTFAEAGEYEKAIEIMKEADNLLKNGWSDIKNTVPASVMS